MWAPWSKPDIRDGEIVSPAKVTSTLSWLSRSALMTAARRAIPPCPPLASIRSRSLKWTMVSSTGAAKPKAAIERSAATASAATIRGVDCGLIFIDVSSVDMVCEAMKPSRFAEFR